MRKCGRKELKRRGRERVREGVLGEKKRGEISREGDSKRGR